MGTLIFILIAIIWISYGAFNSSQHDWFEDEEPQWFAVFLNILVAPLSLVIRIFRGVFIWKGKY